MLFFFNDVNFVTFFYFNNNLRYSNYYIIYFMKSCDKFNYLEKFSIISYLVADVTLNICNILFYMILLDI
jgi:hypothetical protein